jgi:hypothetical protein
VASEIMWSGRTLDLAKFLEGDLPPPLCPPLPYGKKGKNRKCQCAVGRVKVGVRWGIIDLNYGCASTTFMGNEGEGESSDED